jgi:hypothetical protein
MRILGGLFATIFILIAIGVFCGERYGRRKPTPGHSVQGIVCGKYELICTKH